MNYVINEFSYDFNLISNNNEINSFHNLFTLLYCIICTYIFKTVTDKSLITGVKSHNYSVGNAQSQLSSLKLFIIKGVSHFLL